MSKSDSLIKSSERVRDLGEVFTPDFLVEKMLDQFPLDAWEPDKNWLEPTCGNGQFILGVLRRKIAANLLTMKPFVSLMKALNTTFGIDIMKDNIFDCQKRILNEIVVPHWKVHKVYGENRKEQQLKVMCIVHNNIRHTKDSLQEDFGKFQYFIDLPKDVQNKRIVKMQALITKWEEGKI
jgi:hypothetical protein